MTFVKMILLALLCRPAFSAGDTCEVEGGCDEEGFVQLRSVGRHEPRATVQAANPKYFKDGLMPIGYRQTRFGHIHEDCMLQIQSSSAVKELNTGEVQITHGDGSVETRAACVHPILNSKLHPSPHSEELLEVHHGNFCAASKFHSYGSECSPANGCPTDMVFREMRATWTVPEPPKNHTGDGRRGSRADVTLSWWPGIEGGFTSLINGQRTRVPYIMQPVMEYNSLASTGRYADRGVIVSFNCCPAGHVVHSTPIPVKPGDQVHGEIFQIAPKVYDITTTLGRTGQKTKLTADFRGVSDWNANKATVLADGYYVSGCEHLSASKIVFSGVNIVPPPPVWTEAIAGMSGWSGGTCGRYASDSKVTAGSQHSPGNGIIVIGFSAINDCRDTEKNHCQNYKKSGYCSNVPNIRAACKKTCGLCR